MSKNNANNAAPVETPKNVVVKTTKTAYDNNSPAFTQEVAYNFDGVTQEEILSLAADSVRIRYQSRLRKGSKDAADFAANIKGDPSPEVHVATLIERKVRTGSTAKAVAAQFATLSPEKQAEILALLAGN